MVCPSCGHENPADAKFCSECGTSLAAAAHATEQRKVVTVVFSDVTGSTALGERLDPESLRRVLARYFELASQVVERHGGVVEKFIGDAVMAVFGIPQVHEDDALRAVRAAAEMRAALEALNAELERDYATSLSVRIGVNTGEVVTGDRASALATGTRSTSPRAWSRLPARGDPARRGHGRARSRRRHGRGCPSARREREIGARARYRLLSLDTEAPAFVRRGDVAMVGRDRQLSSSATPSTTSPASAPAISSPSWARPASGSRG